MISKGGAAIVQKTIRAHFLLEKSAVTVVNIRQVIIQQMVCGVPPVCCIIQEPLLSGCASLNVDVSAGLNLVDYATSISLVITNLVLDGHVTGQNSYSF